MTSNRNTKSTKWFTAKALFQLGSRWYTRNSTRNTWTSSHMLSKAKKKKKKKNVRHINASTDDYCIVLTCTSLFFLHTCCSYCCLIIVIQFIFTGYVCYSHDSNSIRYSMHKNHMNILDNRPVNRMQDTEQIWRKWKQNYNRQPFFYEREILCAKIDRPSSTQVAENGAFGIHSTWILPKWHTYQITLRWQYVIWSAFGR